MGFLSAVAALGAMVVAGVMHFWVISLGLALAAALALTVGAATDLRAFRHYVPRLAVVYLLPVATVLIGAALRYDHALHGSVYIEPSTAYGVALWMPFALYLLAAMGALVWLRRWRLRIAAFLAPGLWLLLHATFVAAIAIAGVGP